MNYLRLVRYKNLLIIIATMLVIRYALIATYMPLQLSLTGFFLLVLATVCIAAAGYIINDYFDVNADMMNRPDSVIIGKTIPRRNAMILHWALNIIGCVAGGLVSFGVGRPNYTFIFLFIAGILWFYSTTFSKEPILGNIVVAFMVASVPFIEVFYETIPLLAMPIDAIRNMNVNLEEILVWSVGYTVFAFLLTFQRELVKDIEDVEGDRTYGRNTLPIAFGYSVARYVTIGVSFVVILCLIYSEICKLHDFYSLLFINIGLIVPLLMALVIFIKAQSVKEYHTVSLILKLVMLMGLVYVIPNLFA